MKSTHYLIALHPINGLDAKRIAVTDENVDKQFPDFDAYEDHALKYEVESYEPQGYNVITVKERELDDIIESLIALKQAK